MTKATKGSEVSVHYTGTFDDGTVFDTSAEREPLSFVLGEGTVIPGFENAVEGMEVGEKKNVSIEPDDAYGPHVDDMVISSPLSELPVENPEVGMVLQANVQDQVVYFVISNIENDVVTLDGNHPMAGKRLNFELELVTVGE